MDQLPSHESSAPDEETVTAFLTHVRELIEGHQFESAATILLEKAKAVSLDETPSCAEASSRFELSDRLAYHSLHLSRFKGPSEAELSAQRTEIEEELNGCLDDGLAKLKQVFDHIYSLNEIIFMLPKSLKDDLHWLEQELQAPKNGSSQIDRLFADLDATFFQSLRELLGSYQELPPIRRQRRRSINAELAAVFAENAAYIKSGQYWRYVELRSTNTEILSAIDAAESRALQAETLWKRFDEVSDCRAGCYHQASEEAARFTTSFSEFFTTTPWPSV